MSETRLQQDNLEAECREAIERIRHKQDALASILACMVDGILLVDAEGSLAFWNSKAVELLGEGFRPSTDWSAEELEQEMAALTANPEEALRGLRVTPEERHGLPKVELDIVQTRRLVQARQFPIHGRDGEDLGYGIMLRDVTERREADRIKARLLAMVSHELRAPLASIKGFASTLLRPDVEWQKDEEREFLEIINRQSDRLAALIDELFDNSRLVLGEYPIEPGEIPLGELTREAVAQAEARAPEHSFRLQVPDVLPPAWADERRIWQVLNNLLDNAAKYSPKESEVLVEVVLSDGSLVVSVRDQGPGISPEEQALIFEPFYRGRTAQDVGQKGLGLGLAICKGIVEAHGGRIWVESTPGQGATFFFCLPVAGATPRWAGLAEGATSIETAAPGEE